MIVSIFRRLLKAIFVNCPLTQFTIQAHIQLISWNEAVLF